MRKPYNVANAQCRQFTTEILVGFSVFPDCGLDESILRDHTANKQYYVLHLKAVQSMTFSPPAWKFSVFPDYGLNETMLCWVLSIP